MLHVHRPAPGAPRAASGAASGRPAAGHSSHHAPAQRVDVFHPAEHGHAPHKVPPVTGPGEPPRMGVHGMVLFGDASAPFFSHIPMFHPPHDVQLVVQAKLAGAPAEGLDFSRQLFTLQPKPFDLNDLVSGKLTRFQGDLYRGNFEQGGTLVAKDVTAEVTRRVAAQPLRDDTQGAPALTYSAYGRPGQTFLVHTIGAPPSFDQVVRASVDGASAQALDSGLKLSLEGRPDELGERLRPGEVATATLEDGKKVGVRVADELSCLVGPHFDRPAPPVL